MLTFNEETHEYTLDGRKLISVTQLMQKHNLSPSYSNVSVEVLQKKAERGSLVHKEIEDYNKTKDIGFTFELGLYKKYINENNVDVIESEMQVHNDIVAGTIDLVFYFKDNLYVCDIKTTYTLHKRAVRWQLSIYCYLYWYKRFTDRDMLKKYYNTTLGQAYHFTKEKTLNVVDIPLRTFEEVEELMECERKGILYKGEENE